MKNNQRMYLPVITGKFWSEALAVPWLHLVAKKCVVSYPYAIRLKQWPLIKCILDSGSFALIKGYKVNWSHTNEGIEINLFFQENTIIIKPYALVEFMETKGLDGFTLDIPIPINTPFKESSKRLDASLEAGAWMLEHAQKSKLWFTLPVYEDKGAMEQAINIIASLKPYGIALGGLVPRYKTEILNFVVERSIETGLPVHVLGIGDPQRVLELWDLGITSVDSSTYARMAAAGKSFLGESIEDPSPIEIRDLMLKNLAYMNIASMPLAWKVLTRLFNETE